MSEIETKNTTKRAKLGRKRINLSDKATLKKIKHLAGLGLSDVSIAASLGVSPRTILRRKKDSVIFDEAIKEGKASAIEKVSNALFNSAIGSAGEKPSNTAQIFFLKNRGHTSGLGGWRDRVEQVTTHSINLAEIIGSRKLALAATPAPALPPSKGIILDNEE